MGLTLPAAFEERMKEMLMAEWEDFLACFLEDRYQALRLNTLKISDCEETRSLLTEAQMGEGLTFEPVPWAKGAYYYGEECRPGRHPYHEMGLYYIQEPSAMSAAAVLAPEPGMRVLDLCAAPGGKTTQLASMMGQKGFLLANEINSGRARILSSNIERMGIRNCMVTNEDSQKLRMHFGSFFHKILVDAPCSGEGMFRKNPMAVNEWSPQNVSLCAKRQEEILDNAAEMLLPGGELVYSTCTFAPEENEGQIEAFLLRHPEFCTLPIDVPYFAKGNPAWTKGKVDPDQIRNTCRLWPQKLHGEGHYVARLKKNGILPDYRETTVKEEKPAGSKGKRGKAPLLEKEKLKLLQEFMEQTLLKDTIALIDMDRLALFGEHLYMLPSGSPSFRGIHVLRAGLELGEFKKNRFEPSHALALTLSPDDCRNVVNIPVRDARADAYYRGESISVPEEGTAKGKGWCLFCLDSYSAGWGKLTGSVMKNHYPKGLRYDYSID